MTIRLIQEIISCNSVGRLLRSIGDCIRATLIRNEVTIDRVMKIQKHDPRHWVPNAVPELDSPIRHRRNNQGTTTKKIRVNKSSLSWSGRRRKSRLLRNQSCLCRWSWNNSLLACKAGAAGGGYPGSVGTNRAFAGGSWNNSLLVCLWHCSRTNLGGRAQSRRWRRVH